MHLVKSCSILGLLEDLLGFKPLNMKTNTPFHVLGILTVWLLGYAHLLAQSGETLSFKVSDTQFEAPKAWVKIQPSSSMRKAQFAVKREGIQDAGEVVFFHFGPGGAGGVTANIQRWYKQFKEPVEQLGTQTEKMDVEGVPLTLVRASGTFMSGSPFGPKTAKANYSMLAGILESPKGSIFVKFTGPRDLVQDARKEFLAMLKSARIRP